MKNFKFLRGYDNSITLTMEMREIYGDVRLNRAQWTPELAQDLNAFHGIDIVDEISALLSLQISNQIDNYIITQLVELQQSEKKFTFFNGFS
jgi:hypothetical protein